MKNDKIEEIVSVLINSTKLDISVWEIKSTIFNSDLNRYFVTKSEDGKTRFEIQITIDDNYQLKSYYNSLYIYNDNLLNGLLLVHADDYSVIKDLHILMYNKYVYPNLPKKLQSKALVDILQGISKQGIRDIRISKIISKEGEPVKSKKSIIKKLLKL